MIKSLLLHRPLLVVFDVTKRCNSRCSMCNIWKNPSKISDELTINEIEKIFTDLKHFGIRQVFLQGGEPLLRSDIFEIIELLIKLGFKPTLITNGFLLDKNKILRLAKLKCNVSVSLDSLKRSVYKKIRGVDAFDLVKSNLLFASKVKRKTGAWFINSTISEINYKELLSLYNFALSNNFYFQVYPYNYSICKASAKDKSLVFKNIKKIINSFNEFLIEARRSNNLVNELITLEILNYLRGNYTKTCDALRNSMMLDERGRLAPCIELSSEFDLKKESIFKVWSKFNKDRVKQCYLGTPCFYGCTRTSGIMVRNWFSFVKLAFSDFSSFKKLLKCI